MSEQAPENGKNISQLEQDSEAQAAYSRREVLRLIGVAGALAGLDRMMPPRWLAPEAAALGPVEAPQQHWDVKGELFIANLSFSSGLEPYDGIGREVVNGNGYFCDVNASFYFSSQSPIVNGLTLLSMNTVNLGVVYNEGIGTIHGSRIENWGVLNGLITVPLPRGTVPADTVDQMAVAITTPDASRSNTLVETFLPACGQTTIMHLSAEPVPDSCLEFNADGLACPTRLTFRYSGTAPELAAGVFLHFNGQVVLSGLPLSELNGDIAGGVVTFDVSLPAGQLGNLDLVIRNAYGFDSNMITRSGYATDCVAVPAAEIYNQQAIDNQGQLQVRFDYRDDFNRLDNSSLVTAWLGANAGMDNLLLNAVAIGSIGGLFVNNLSSNPAHCGFLILNSQRAYGFGRFAVPLDALNVSSPQQLDETEVLNFLLDDNDSSARTNTAVTGFEPTAVGLSELTASAPVGGLVGALGAAALGAATLWAKFRGDAQADEFPEDGDD